MDSIILPSAALTNTYITVTDLGIKIRLSKRTSCTSDLLPQRVQSDIGQVDADRAEMEYCTEHFGLP